MERDTGVAHMRKLLYIPIIHGEADLGGAAEAITSTSTLAAGKDRWTRHLQTVDQFWKNIAEYLRTHDRKRMKLYHDGMPSDGDMGRLIVLQAAKRGSRDYQLVQELVDGGAELRKTEDIALLLAEDINIRNALQKEGGQPNIRNQEQYRRTRDDLTEKRDRFIASAINSTLREPELGVLFIGAGHNVVPLLATDISATMVKDQNKIKSYFEELFSGKNKKRFEELSSYLASPVTI